MEPCHLHVNRMIRSVKRGHVVMKFHSSLLIHLPFKGWTTKWLITEMLVYCWSCCSSDSSLSCILFMTLFLLCLICQGSNEKWIRWITNLWYLRPTDPNKLPSDNATSMLDQMLCKTLKRIALPVSLVALAISSSVQNGGSLSLSRSILSAAMNLPKLHMKRIVAND